MQVDDNPLTTSVVNCNTSIQALMVQSQAKSAMYYLVEYLSKHGFGHGAILSIMHTQNLLAQQFPSTAEDSGTDSRNAKYILQKTLNKIFSTQEISQEQIALALLNYKCHYQSHEFSYCYIGDVITKYNNNQLFNKDKIHKEKDHNITSFLMGTSSKNKAFLISQHLQYQNRGQHLDEISLFDYCSVINFTKTKTKQSQYKPHTSTSGPGRPPSTHFPFTNNMLPGYHQYIRSKLKIPILIGSPPPPFCGEEPNRTTHPLQWKTLSPSTVFYSFLGMIKKAHTIQLDHIFNFYLGTMIHPGKIFKH